MSHVMSSARFRCTTTNLRKTAEFAKRKSPVFWSKEKGAEADPQESVNSQLLKLPKSKIEQYKAVQLVWNLYDKRLYYTVLDTFVFSFNPNTIFNSRISQQPIQYPDITFETSVSMSARTSIRRQTVQSKPLTLSLPTESSFRFRTISSVLFA